MRGARWTLLGLLAVTSAGLFACSSDTITPGTLGFTIAESLLVLYPEDATNGYVLLSSGTGNCAALQSGVILIPDTQIASLDYVYMPLGQVDASDAPLPLSAATYNIVDPNNPVDPAPGLYAYFAALQTDAFCNPMEADANSGTVTVSPFDTADGGTSNVTYSSIFGTTSISGTYPLTTCLVSVNTPVADAGTCVECIAPGDGGACAVQ